LSLTEEYSMSQALREGHQLLPKASPVSSREKYASERFCGHARIAGAEVAYTYERPLEYITDEVPLLIVPGYAGIKPAYRRFREEIVQTGKPAITLRPVREQAIAAALHPHYLLHPGALPTRAAYGVLSDIQEQFDIDQFDIAGHSMGGWVVSLLASRHPAKVRSASFVASAGLEDHSLATLIGRLPDFMAHEFLPQFPALAHDSGIRLAAETLHYVWRNPYRTCVEGIGVSSCDIRPTLSHLGELGIKTAIMNFGSDHLICNLTTQTEVGHIVDYCETHPDRSLGHLAPQLQPQVVASRLVDIIDTITSQ
jgi:pimeloyl-ACP methyl ester carboxylesterase